MSDHLVPTDVVLRIGSREWMSMAVLHIDGERVYMLLGGDATVSLMPAAVVEAAPRLRRGPSLFCEKCQAGNPHRGH